MKDYRKDSYERLIHIQKAINEIETFTLKVSKNDFLNDNFLSSAVLFQFSVIGEAVVHIEAVLLDKYEYPWYKVRAFRNLISHQYFNIKLEAVWDIIKNDLSKLKQIVETILRNEF
ncbi:MAG: HepT-like ribonuclease domain-containing protein [Bacteroidota bacterium]|nr:HepT-like ribonuclease domain-containing protein [Bacteroidota bacterium]